MSTNDGTADSGSAGSSRTQRRNRNRRRNRAKRTGNQSAQPEFHGFPTDPMLPRVPNAPAVLSSLDQDWSFLDQSRPIMPDTDEPLLRGGYHPMMDEPPRTPPKFNSMEEYEQWVYGPPSDDDDEPPLRGGYHPMMDEPPRTPPKFTSMEEYEEWVNGPPSDDDADDADDGMEAPPRFNVHEYLTRLNGGDPNAPIVPGTAAHDAMGAMMEQVLSQASGPGGSGFFRRPKIVDGYYPPMPYSARKIPRMCSLEEYLDWTDDPEAYEEAYGVGDDSDDDWGVDADTRHLKQSKRKKNKAQESYNPANKADNKCFNGETDVYVKSDIPFNMSRRYPNPNPPVYLGPVGICSIDGNKTMTVTAPAHRDGLMTVPFSHIQPCFNSVVSGYPVEPPWETNEATRRMQRGEVACCVAIIKKGEHKEYYVNWQGVNPFWVSSFGEAEFNRQDLKDILARSVAPGEEIPVIHKQ